MTDWQHRPEGVKVSWAGHQTTCKWVSPTGAACSTVPDDVIVGYQQRIAELEDELEDVRRDAERDAEQLGFLRDLEAQFSSVFDELNYAASDTPTALDFLESVEVEIRESRQRIAELEDDKRALFANLTAQIRVLRNQESDDD